jgi:hypothetical protein
MDMDRGAAEAAFVGMKRGLLADDLFHDTADT